MPRPPLGFLPSEPCSSPRSTDPLGPAMLPCSCSPVVKTPALSRGPRSPHACRAALRPGFHRRPRREARLPGSPPELGRRFDRRSPADVPAALDRAPPCGAHVTGSVCFEALIPPRSRAGSVGVTRPLRPLLSWAFAPPEPCSDRASGPVHPVGPTRRLPRGKRRAACPPRASTGDDGECDPPPPGEGRRASRPPAPRRRHGPRCERGPARAASRRHPCLPRPWVRACYGAPPEAVHTRGTRPGSSEV